MHLNPFTAAHPAGPLAPGHANPLLGGYVFAPRVGAAFSFSDPASEEIAGRVFGAKDQSFSKTIGIFDPVSSGLPSQTGNAGKLLTTDGSAASWARTLAIDDASTNSVLTVLELNRTTSGTAANGIGARLRLGAKDDGGTTQTAGDISARWTTAASASRKSAVAIDIYEGSTARTMVEAGWSGADKALGFFGFTPIAQPSGEIGAALQNLGLLASSPTPFLNFPIVHLRDEKANTTGGGTFTSGSFQTRTLNAEKSDAAGLCSLSGNQFTLTAGTYWLLARAPATGCSLHKTRVRNITDGSTVLVGSNAYADVASNGANDSWVFGRFTIAASKALELQHYCATNGTFGAATSSGEVEVYAEVFLIRVA